MSCTASSDEVLNSMQGTQIVAKDKKKRGTTGITRFSHALLKLTHKISLSAWLMSPIGGFRLLTESTLMDSGLQRLSVNMKSGARNLLCLRVRSIISYT